MAHVREKALALVLVLLAPASGGEVSKGLENFKERFASPSADVRTSAVEDLDGLDSLVVTKRIATTAFHDPESVVHRAAVRVLGRVKDPESVGWLVESALKVDKPQARYLAVESVSRLQDPRIDAALEARLQDPSWLVATAAARALGTRKVSSSAGALRGLLAHKDFRVRIAAADALASLEDPASASALIALLGTEKEWRVRAAACEALSALKAVQAIPALRKAASAAEGRPKDDLLLAVKRLQEVEEAGKTAADGIEDPYAITYEGIGCNSKQVVFIMDCSASMEPPIGLSAKTVELEEGCEATKLGVCQSELIRALRQLQKTGGKFNLVFVHSQNDVWEKALVPATPENVSRAIRHVKRQKPSGRTNLCDALLSVLEIQDGGAVDLKPEDLKDAPDTLFVLSDGDPNEGKFKRPNDVLEVVSEFNLHARARIHGIGTGQSPFLERLAKLNQGTFVKKIEF